MAKAASMQEDHIDSLLLEPRFVEELSQVEIRDQFDRLRLVMGNMKEVKGKSCERCGVFRPTRTILLGLTDCPTWNCSSKGLKLKDVSYWLSPSEE